MQDSPAYSVSPPSPKAEVVAAEQPFFSFEDFYKFFKRTRIFILFVCFVVGAAVFLSARQDMRMSPNFSSSTEIEILPSDLQLNFARVARGGTRDAQIATIVRSFSEELQSDEVLARAVATVFASPAALPQETGTRDFGGKLSGFIDWLNYGESPKTATDPLEVYRDAIKIESIDGSFVLRISATFSDAKQAADLANAVFSTYAEIEREKLYSAHAAMLAMYSAKLEDAKTELRGLIELELELGASVPVAAKDAGTIVAPPVEAAVELRLNLQSQEAVVRAIVALRSEVVSAEKDAVYIGSQAFVLRKALPARLPDGPTPVIKSVAYAVGLFIFLIGSLILASMLRVFFKKTATNQVAVSR